MNKNRPNQRGKNKKSRTTLNFDALGANVIRINSSAMNMGLAGYIQVRPDGSTSIGYGQQDQKLKLITVPEIRKLNMASSFRARVEKKNSQEEKFADLNIFQSQIDEQNLKLHDNIKAEYLNFLKTTEVVTETRKEVVESNHALGNYLKAEVDTLLDLESTYMHSLLTKGQDCPSFKEHATNNGMLDYTYAALNRKDFEIPPTGEEYSLFWSLKDTKKNLYFTANELMHPGRYENHLNRCPVLLETYRATRAMYFTQLEDVLNDHGLDPGSDAKISAFLKATDSVPLDKLKKTKFSAVFTEEVIFDVFKRTIRKKKMPAKYQISDVSPLRQYDKAVSILNSAYFPSVPKERVLSTWKDIFPDVELVRFEPGITLDYFDQLKSNLLNLEFNCTPPKMTGVGFDSDDVYEIDPIIPEPNQKVEKFEKASVKLVALQKAQKALKDREIKPAPVKEFKFNKQSNLQKSARKWLNDQIGRKKLSPKMAKEISAFLCSFPTKELQTYALKRVIITWDNEDFGPDGLEDRSDSSGESGDESDGDQKFDNLN